MSKRKDDIEALAGEYVLGTLDGEARTAFAERLKRDPALQEKVEAWHRKLEALDPVGETVDPPTGLWDRIADALDDGDAAAPEIGATTIRSGEEGWFGWGPGVEKKVLHVDRAAGFESYLLRMAAGARLPAHEHGATEECLMLEGEITIGDLRLAAGDYHVVAAGTGHPEIISETGAVAYLRTEIRAHSR